MTSSKEQEQADRRRLAGSTTSITNDNPATTYHQLSGLGDTSLGGRFAAGGDVSGTEEVVRYPRLPSTSPWASDPVGVEPPTNYRIDDLEPTGEFHELAASGPPFPEATDTPAPTTSDGAGAALQVASPSTPNPDGDASRAGGRLHSRRVSLPLLMSQTPPAFSSGKISRAELDDLLGRLVVPKEK